MQGDGALGERRWFVVDERRKLGEGGCGVVFAAEECTPERPQYDCAAKDKVAADGTMPPAPPLLFTPSAVLLTPLLTTALFTLCVHRSRPTTATRPSGRRR